MAKKFKYILKRDEKFVPKDKREKFKVTLIGDYQVIETSREHPELEKKE